MSEWLNWFLNPLSWIMIGPWWFILGGPIVLALFGWWYEKKGWG